MTYNVFGGTLNPTLLLLLPLFSLLTTFSREMDWVYANKKSHGAINIINNNGVGTGECVYTVEIKLW